jgi:formate hydrogenlyase subunit 6/NADH:ubiquinone oxidoreductase subunit I
MAHHTVRAGYTKLVDRLNRYPQGAPPSELLYRILQMLFNEREAGLVSLLPIKPFDEATAARIWKMAPERTTAVLEELADRGILLDIRVDDRQLYVLPPPMAGFFEFSMMRVREDVDQKLLAELFYQYLNVEEEFVKALFTGGETELGRTFVNESVLPDDVALQVLDYERASEIIRSATHIGVGVCYCRHKMQHMDRACDAPMKICMTFNTVAESLTRHDVARPIDAVECLDLLDEAREHRLVQFGENVQRGVNFICNCCGCCCEAMLAARRFGILNSIQTTKFLPRVDPESCHGCGKCVAACPVEAMSLVSANDPAKPGKKASRLDESICLGCGVCATICPQGGIRLESRPERVITPINSTHKVVLMAIERGMLQDLIFDNRALMSHRAMAAILGVILRLPPVKRALANRQVQSRYLEGLILRMS